MALNVVRLTHKKIKTMKITIFLILLLITLSCQSTKTIMDSWLGSSKQNLIMTWGPPEKVIENSPNGTILVYVNRVYTEPILISGAYVGGENYWRYKYMYVDNNGKIYHWRIDKQQIAPEQIDLNIRKYR
jgi:hypothetical protein